ncbi:MAG: hypothetical protein AAFQ94_06695 [Bacteroidota bacterium]
MNLLTDIFFRYTYRLLATPFLKAGAIHFDGEIVAVISRFTAIGISHR